VSATPADGSVSIEFTAGATGGAAITNYAYSIDDGANWTMRSPSSTSSPLAIASLSNGTAYTIKLKAVNAAGDGAASTSVSVTPRTTPSAPTGLVATPGDGSVEVAFTPGSDGGASITNYKYSIDDGANWSTRSPSSTTSPISITGLVNGTTYTIKLLAVNAAGDGAASSAVSVTPSSVGVVWTSRTAASVATWSSVAGGNGVFVAVGSDGAVMSSEDGVVWTTRTAASASSWVSVSSRSSDGLFVAVAMNGSVMSSVDGVSWVSQTAPSQQWMSVTSRSLDGLFVAVAMDGSVMTSPDGVVWTSRTAASSGDWSSVTSRSLDGLFVAVAMNGSVMTSVDGVTWVSQTAASSSDWSSVTARGTDGLFVAVGSDGSVMTSADGDLWVSQTAASSSTWSAVRSCEAVLIAVATDGSVMTSTDGVTWFARSAAEPNAWTSIACGPRGLRVVVGSDGSDQVMTSGALVRPVAPRITNTTVGNQTVTVTFSAGSARVSGSPVATGFQYQLNSSGAWRTASSSTFTISGLTNGTSYTVRVRGLNADGAGLASKPVSVTPGVVPSPPGQPTLDSVTATSATISWVASTPKTGLPVVSYTYSAYSVLGGATAVSSCNTALLTCTISGLTAGVRYTIKGIATNVIGDGATSKALGSVIPRAVPSTPTITTVIDGTTSRQAVVSWSATTANGSPVTNYTVTTFTTGGTAVSRGCSVNGTRTSCTVTALPTGGSYEFRLTATNAVGISTEATYGPWTN